MRALHEVPSEVLKNAFYDLRIDSISPPARPGLSGSPIFRVKVENETYRLRGIDRARSSLLRVAAIQEAISAIAAFGCSTVTAPLQFADGSKFYKSAGYYWEYARWLPGEAFTFEQYTPQRIAAAMRALAEFHVIAAEIPLSNQLGSRYDRVSRIATERIAELEQRKMGFAHRSIRFEDLPNDPLIHALFAEATVALARVDSCYLVRFRGPAAVPRVLQLCLRDVWREHVLFDQERVSGLIDYDALCHETPCVDIARLLGSIAGDDPNNRETAFAAYESVRALTASERKLVEILDHLAVLLTPWQWLGWMSNPLIEFSSPAAVRERLEFALQRLRHANGGQGIITS